MDWGLIISIVALCGSVFTYFVHDGKIKKQERLINEYQLDKITEEQTERKKASIKANLIKRPGGNYIIKVFNSGKSSAKNVNFKILNEGNFDILNPQIFPFELLNPQDNTELVLVTYKGSNNDVDKIKVQLTWEDDFSQDNQYIQFLTF